MATTTLLQRHAGEGETIAEAIRDCLDYGKDPEKTESGKYISAYECDPATVADEFLLAKASYAAMTGREQKKENNVLCYQIRQSFYPGEITPKEANRIGYELAMRWTKGRHAFIVTTHTDKQHIHCHIYYNSTTLDCTRKFRNFWGSSFALRRLSDRLCLENGLSIVENPKPRSKGKYRNYGEWQKDRKGPLSYQDRLRLAIDTALAERPADLDEFLNLMKRAGYEVKTVRGGGISFRLTGQGQERFTRLRASTLGDGYGKGEAKVEALKKVTFSLDKGEFAAVVGESGSGKSTLLNCIGALDTPTSGHILVDGQDLFSMKEEQRTIFRRRNIGFIFQSFQLVSELNVEQNIMFPLLLDYRKPDPAAVEEILELLGLTERRHHLPSQLSGGQQQRVAIGRALITKPKLILADEPTGNLDSKNSQDVIALLTQASRRYQQTILMITHNKDLTASVDRVFRVSDGVLTDLGGKTNEALS